MDSEVNLCVQTAQLLQQVFEDLRMTGMIPSGVRNVRHHGHDPARNCPIFFSLGHVVTGLGLLAPRSRRGRTEKAWSAIDSDGFAETSRLALRNVEADD